MGVVTAVHHIHFESRDEGFFGRLLLVGGNALGPQLLDGAPIRHDEPVVSPPLFEHLGHEIAADPGIPLMSLKLLITVAAPAFMPAS